jgi:hypothetical protein
LREVHGCAVLHLYLQKRLGDFPLIFILLDTKVVVVLLALNKKVAEDLMTVYETAADKWLEKSWNGYRVFDNIEHFIDVKVLNDLLVIEYPEMEHPVIYVTEREYVSVLALINDIGFDIVPVYDHSGNTLNLLHQLEIIVFNMINFILFLA